MKKFLKTMLLIVLALATAVSMVACDNGASGGSSKTGISASVNSKGVYEIRKYYAEEGVDTLDLSKIELPEGVTEIKIKSNAFSGNNSLKKIIVPSNTVEIASGAFANMLKLETLELPFVGKDFNADYKQNASSTATSGDAERTIAHIFGTEEYDKGAKVTLTYGASTVDFYVPVTLKNIVINNATEKAYNIPMFAFYGVTAFTSIELKGNIVGIGEYAFCGVGGVDTIVIPATVKNIYKGAFSVNYIKNVVFDNGASNVVAEEDAFANSTLLNFVGKGQVAEYTLDLGVFNVQDLGRNAFNLADNEIKYVVKNASGLNQEKVFGETEIQK